jgi:hypothetical protein
MTTEPDLAYLREMAEKVINDPVDPSVPPYERDLVVTAHDLLWLLDQVDSEPPPCGRNCRDARGSMAAGITYHSADCPRQAWYRRRMVTS